MFIESPIPWLLTTLVIVVATIFFQIHQVSDMATTEANSVGHLGKKRTEFTRKSYSSALLEPLNSTDKRLNPEAPHRSKTSLQSFSGNLISRFELNFVHLNSICAFC